MGRHSIDYQPESGDITTPSSEPWTPAASIAPPGGPVDPGVPGAPDAPSGPDAPDAPDAPSTVPPTEPPPLAPEQPDDGSMPTPGHWHAAGEQVL